MKLKLLIVSLLAPLALLLPAAVMAAPDCADPATLTTADAIQCGANEGAGVPGGANPGTKLNTTIGNIVNLISVVVGIAAVVMIMVGGARFVSSGGKEDSIKAAKSTVVYALIGLIIVALAQIIVRFVLNKTT